jgi:DNA-binding Lrp family transcriptional regulator
LHIAIYDIMKQYQSTMKPQDVVILLKIIAGNSEQWQQKSLADELKMSQSEVSQSVARSKYSGLLDGTGKKVMRLALMDFLQYGIVYVFPQKPGSIVRGVLTAHSALPLSSIIQSNELYVWPSAKGNARGQSIFPLYPSVVDAIKYDEKLYQLLALVDALRVGRAREKELALNELKKRILYGE